MSSTGGIWNVGDTISASRLNQKTVTIDSGLNLPPSTTYPGMLICATDTGSAQFTQGIMYQRDPTNTVWVALNPMTTHDHSTSQVKDGGLLSDVAIANTGQLNWITELMSPRLSDFNTTTTSAGSSVGDNIASNQWRVNIQTGTTGTVSVPNFAQADFGGIKLDFGSKMKFQAKVEQQSVTSFLQGRIGVNIESAGAALSQTTKMLGFEFCDSTGTQYQLVAGNGTSRTVVPTATSGNNILGVHSIKFLYTPGVNVIGTIDQTVAVTNTNVPGTGQVDADKLMRFGIASTNSTAKNLYVHGAVIAGTINDTWFV
jgi:hypothetical protein